MEKLSSPMLGKIAFHNISDPIKKACEGIYSPICCLICFCPCADVHSVFQLFWFAIQISHAELPKHPFASCSLLDILWISTVQKTRGFWPSTVIARLPLRSGWLTVATLFSLLFLYNNEQKELFIMLSIETMNCTFLLHMASHWVTRYGTVTS